MDPISCNVFDDLFELRQKLPDYEWRSSLPFFEKYGAILDGVKVNQIDVATFNHSRCCPIG